MSIPIKTTAEMLADFRSSQFPDRRQLAADYEALAARLAAAEAVAAADGTLHNAIDHWQGRAVAAEARLAEADAIRAEAQELLRECLRYPHKLTSDHSTLCARAMHNLKRTTVSAEPVRCNYNRCIRPKGHDGDHAA